MEVLGVDSLKIGDTPEAGALAAAVASAAVGTTSSHASEFGFSKAADDGPTFNQDGGPMDSIRRGHQGADASVPGAYGKDNDVEGKLFIGGISWQTTEEGLRNHFSKYGTVANIALMKDKYTGHPRGFGFIKFEDFRVLDQILALEHKIDGKVVDVKRAVPKSEAPGPAARANRTPDSNKIFVGGLAPTVMMAEFRKYFENFGGVVDAVVMFDRHTQRSRGFGFVTFQEDSVVHRIMRSTHEINGKIVEVKRAEPKESRNNRASRGEISGGPPPEAWGAEPAPFSGAPRAQPFGPGRGPTAGYGAENSFPYGSNGAAHFLGANTGTYGQTPYGYSGYGYNAQLYAAPTYGSGRGAQTYSAGTGTAAGSFAGPLPPQVNYPLHGQDGHSQYAQAEYITSDSLRNQQHAQHQVHMQAQQIPQVGEEVYRAQLY